MELLAIGFKIFDRSCCNTTFHRRLNHSHGDHFDKTRIKGFRNKIFRAKLKGFIGIGRGHHVGRFFCSQIGNGSYCSHLHFFINGRCTAVQCAAENKREAQNIVDLIRVVGTTRGQNSIRASRHCFFGHNFRNWVRHSQNNWLLAHLLKQVTIEYAWARQTHK